MSSPTRHTPTKPRVPKSVGGAAGSAINTVRQSASRGAATPHGGAASFAASSIGGGRRAVSAGTASLAPSHRGAATLAESHSYSQSHGGAYQQQQQTFKQSRAAALKLEMAGTQRMRQIVELLYDPATSAHYKQHAAGVAECLQCFPDGFTPAIAIDGVGQLVAGMTQVVATEAAGSEQLVPALTAVIHRCAVPLVCVTLEDQHQAEGGIRALCAALCSALTAPVASVRIAAAVGLHRVFSSIRALAGDDLQSEAERREMGEVAVWKVNVRRAVTLEVLQSLCACWSDAIDDEVAKLRALAQQVARVDAAAEGEKIESDEEEAAASSQRRQQQRGNGGRRGSSPVDDSRPSTSLTAVQNNNNAEGRSSSSAFNQQQQLALANNANGGYNTLTATQMAKSAAVVASVRDLDDNARRVARTRDSSVALTEMTTVLKAIREAAAFAPQCAHLAVDCGACGLLVRTMEVCERGDRRVALAIEVLWALLELCPHEAAARCCDAATIEALYQAFVECLSVGYKLKERELRNDLIVVVTAISEAPEAAALLGPFAEILLELSCGNERHGGHSASPFINPKHHYTLSNEDQQAKTLAWGFLARLCQQSTAAAAALAAEGDEEGAEAVASAASTVLEWGFVDVLVSYLDVHCDQPAVVRWSTPQLLDLQEQALLILVQVAEVGWAHFLRCGAPAVLHSFIAECPDVQLRNLALTLLARLAVTDAKVAVAESGAVPVAVQLLTESDDDALSLECLNLLADIVNRDPAQQQLFLACGGVQAVLPRLVFSPTYHTTRREEVVLSAFDCCWSCVFGNVDCERAFIRSGGVSACLLALEGISFPSAPFILSALADLFTNREAIPDVRAWRSPKTGRSGVQLFIELWRKASAAAGSGKMMVGGSSTATAANPFHKDPNMSGLGHPNTTGATTTVAANSGANTTNKRLGQGEVSEAAVAMTRAQGTHIKIYACMCCVGFADHRELTPGERATLSHMEVFEHLCNDLGWAAVNASLTEERIAPIASDRAKLDGVLAEGAARKVALDTIQELYRKEEQQRVTDRETAFYKTIIKKTDEELPPGVVTCGMTITQAKICKSQMLKESVQQAQAHQHAKAVEKARSIGLGGGASSNPTPSPQQQDASAPPTLGAAPPGGFFPHHNTTSKNEAGPSSALNLLNPSTPTGTSGAAGGRGCGEGQKAMTEEEYAILRLINTVRTDPESFIPVLERRAAEVADLVRTNGLAEAQGVTEGVPAVEEAIGVLQSARRIVTFLDVPMGMLFATRDHAADIKGRMDVSPNSHDGATPLQRLMRYGTVPQKSVLLQIVGDKSAEEVMAQLLIDDGVPSRIDRRNLLDPEMRCCAVSVAPHPFHHRVVIIAMAHEYTDKPREQQHDVNRKVHARMRTSVK